MPSSLDGVWNKTAKVISKNLNLYLRLLINFANSLDPDKAGQNALLTTKQKAAVVVVLVLLGLLALILHFRHLIFLAQFISKTAGVHNRNQESEFQ